MKENMITSEPVEGTGDWLILRRLATNGEDGTEFVGVDNLKDVLPDVCLFRSVCVLSSLCKGDV